MADDKKKSRVNPEADKVMKYGILRGWIWIILCTILTYYFYYFPGLIFALRTYMPDSIIDT